MSSPLIENDVLGRLIRSGGWAELAEGTPRLIHRAIDAGDESVIAMLTDFFVQEMRVVFDIYANWFPSTRQCLLDKGMPEADLDRAHADIRDKLAPYHRSAHMQRDAAWNEVEIAAQPVKDSTLSVAERHDAVRQTVETWRDLHDCEVDQLSGLFCLIIDRYGEPALRDMYENWVIGDWFAKRYQRFDVSKISWETASWLLIYLGFEGMHGHISGRDRDGTIDYYEDDEKVSLSFAPCGSGGRSMQGEPRDGLPPLRQLDWPELKDAHDFTWNEKGICAYCAHCCVLHENLPIAKFGYPVRVTNPPKAPLTQESRCSWTVYKDLRNIPEEVYERVGAKKPPREAPLGSAHMDARNALMEGNDG